MKPLAVPAFEPVGVARSYDEMQALLRLIADTSGKSRAQIDADGGLPDRYASKALASVPIGTCQLGARTLEKALKGVGAVLIVARATLALKRAADSGVKRREEQVRARLLDPKVMDAAKRYLARVNGQLGQKAMRANSEPTKTKSNKIRAGRARWKGVGKRERKRIASNAAKARWSKPTIVELAMRAEQPCTHHGFDQIVPISRGIPHK